MNLEIIFFSQIITDELVCIKSLTQFGYQFHLQTNNLVSRDFSKSLYFKYLFISQFFFGGGFFFISFYTL